MSNSSQQRRECNRNTQSALDSIRQAIAKKGNLASSSSLTITQIKIERFVGEVKVRGGIVGLQSYFSPKVIDKRIDLNAESRDKKRKADAAPYQLLGISK